MKLLKLQKCHFTEEKIKLKILKDWLTTDQSRGRNRESVRQPSSPGFLHFPAKKKRRCQASDLAMSQVALAMSVSFGGLGGVMKGHRDLVWSSKIIWDQRLLHSCFSGHPGPFPLFFLCVFGKFS